MTAINYDEQLHRLNGGVGALAFAFNVLARLNEGNITAEGLVPDKDIRLDFDESDSVIFRYFGLTASKVTVEVENIWKYTLPVCLQIAENVTSEVWGRDQRYDPNIHSKEIVAMCRSIAVIRAAYTHDPGNPKWLGISQAAKKPWGIATIGWTFDPSLLTEGDKVDVTSWGGYRQLFRLLAFLAYSICMESGRGDEFCRGPQMYFSDLLNGGDVMNLQMP